MRVLRKLGYSTQKRKAGSGILFFSPSRNLRLVSLRESHSGQNMCQRMLHEYHRQLLLTPDEFTRLLEDCYSGATFTFGSQL